MAVLLSKTWTRYINEDGKKEESCTVLPWGVEPTGEQTGLFSEVRILMASGIYKPARMLEEGDEIATFNDHSHLLKPAKIHNIRSVMSSGRVKICIGVVFICCGLKQLFQNGKGWVPSKSIVPVRSSSSEENNEQIITIDDFGLATYNDVGYMEESSEKYLIPLILFDIEGPNKAFVANHIVTMF